LLVVDYIFRFCWIMKEVCVCGQALSEKQKQKNTGDGFADLQ